MKKFILILSLFFIFPLHASTSTISYDKSGFEKIYNVIDDAAFDLRYYSSYNFTGKRVKGYKAPVAYMTKESLKALAKAADYLRKRGYRLLIWDAYRPQKAVDTFAEWMNNPDDEGNKSFYPELNKEDLVGHYVSTKSGHPRGSTVDLTIIKMDGSSVDMGGTFDLFSEISHPYYKNLTKEQRRNRDLLRRAMFRAGFVGISTEWWHYTYKDEPYKDTYFNFDVE